LYLFAGILSWEVDGNTVSEIIFFANESPHVIENPILLPMRSRCGVEFEYFPSIYKNHEKASMILPNCGDPKKTN